LKKINLAKLSENQNTGLLVLNEKFMELHRQTYRELEEIDEISANFNENAFRILVLTYIECLTLRILRNNKYNQLADVLDTYWRERLAKAYKIDMEVANNIHDNFEKIHKKDMTLVPGLAAHFIVYTEADFTSKDLGDVLLEVKIATLFGDHARSISTFLDSEKTQKFIKKAKLA